MEHDAHHAAGGHVFARQRTVERELGGGQSGLGARHPRGRAFGLALLARFGAGQVPRRGEQPLLGAGGEPFPRVPHGERGGWCWLRGRPSCGPRVARLLVDPRIRRGVACGVGPVQLVRRPSARGAPVAVGRERQRQRSRVPGCRSQLAQRVAGGGGAGGGGGGDGHAPGCFGGVRRGRLRERHQRRDVDQNLRSQRRPRPFPHGRTHFLSQLFVPRHVGGPRLDEREAQHDAAVHLGG
mmetsp:Transcript_63779/g.128132  ORF Transcript_63779/g.128132 Transcript_63779/m.128132 type:complete len:239 (-) Transcript_63779:890-1606(-)